MAKTSFASSHVAKAPAGHRKGRAAPKTRLTRLRLEPLEERIALATRTWTGLGADNLWTTAGNWSANQPPQTSDDLVFQAGALQPANKNNFPAGKHFRSITLQGGGYTITGNQLSLDFQGITSSAGVNVIETDLVVADQGSNHTHIDVASGATLQIGGPDGGVISGTGGITKLSGGQLILNNANTYQGQSTLAGLTTLENASALGAGGSSTNDTTVAGTLQILGNLTIANEGVSLGNNDALESVSGTSVWGGDVSCVSGPGILNVDAGSQLTVSGVLHGNGSCTKVGPGKLVLTAANQNFGSINVNEGTLNVQNGQALGLGAATTVAVGATLEVQGGITLGAQQLVLNGLGSGLGALRGVGGDSTINASTAVNLAGITLIGVDTFSTLTIQGVISGVSGADLLKGSGGTLILTAANTYPGTTTINNGILQVSNDFALGSVVNGTSVGSLGTLEVDGNGFAGQDALSLTGAGFNGLGALHNLIGANDWDGNITLNGTATVRNDFPLAFDLNGVISGGTSAQLIKTGTGAVRLNGINTYQGLTQVNQGTLAITRIASLGATSNGTSVASGASLAVSGNITVSEPLTLTGAGANGNGALINSADQNHWAGFITLVGPSPVTIGVTGILTSTGGFDDGSVKATLTKVGSGTLVIANSVIYDNTMSVNAGGVLVNGFHPATPVVVNSGGKLGGGSGVADITVNANGHVDPGSDFGVAGQLSASGNITLNAGSFFHVQLSGTAAGDFDQLRTAGSNTTVTLNGALLEVTCVNFNPPAGSQFTLIDNTSSGSTSGTLTVGGQTVPQGGFFNACGLSFQMNYTGGNFNDVVITRNTPPMARRLALAPSEINEGQTTTLHGQLVDPNFPTDHLTLTVDWGDGSPVEYHTDVGISPFALPHTYLNNGDYLVHASWFDNHGEGNSRDLSLTVDNVAPTLDGLAVTSPIQVGDFATLSGAITDPGPVDAHTLIVDWGDGSSVDAFSYAPGTNSFAEKHQYTQAGTFTIQLSLFDDVDSTSASISIDVEGPPSGGPGRRPDGGQAALASSNTQRRSGTSATDVQPAAGSKGTTPAEQEAPVTTLRAAAPRSWALSSNSDARSASGDWNWVDWNLLAV
jgi:autotransporter-associated beta strand protein